MPNEIFTKTMRAGRQYAAKDIRIDNVPSPPLPKKSSADALIKVAALGICGSDLLGYGRGEIGDTVFETPLIIGHEFGGTVVAVGENALDGNSRPLSPGTRVAVDPAFPCGECEWCRKGAPNLCENLPFCGLYPQNGGLCERIMVPGRNCFPVPDSIPDEQVPLLEPLGIALHSLELAKPKLDRSAAIFGAGPIGLIILQLLRISGVSPIFVSDRLDWRLELALKFGADEVFHCDNTEPASEIFRATQNRGVDLAIESAHGGKATHDAVESAARGGKVVLVGIDPDDRVEFRHSAARRKGLSILMVRRMKHTYPLAIRLVSERKVDLASLISHRFPLEKAPEAFRLNAEYADDVVKVVIMT